MSKKNKNQGPQVIIPKEPHYPPLEKMPNRPVKRWKSGAMKVDTTDASPKEDTERKLKQMEKAVETKIDKVEQYNREVLETPPLTGGTLLGDKVVIKLFRLPERTKSGLFIATDIEDTKIPPPPGKKKEKVLPFQFRGKVLAVGTGVPEQVKKYVKVGSIVRISAIPLINILYIHDKEEFDLWNPEMGMMVKVSSYDIEWVEDDASEQNRD